MQADQILSLAPWVMAFVFGTFILLMWRNDRHQEMSLRERELRTQMELRTKEIEAKRAVEVLEEKSRSKQADEENTARYWRERREEEERIREKAGASSGGFIVVDIAESQRGMFQDLLKGFEEYAKLKGYGVAFSVDNTFVGKVAFKFTLTDPDVVVVNDRVRKDLREYLEKVKAGDPLDDMPTIVSLEEHELLVASLKNRISFLQHNYNLSKNASDFYENIVRKISGQPVLSSPSVFVQTGGNYAAPSYIANHSPQATLGHENQVKNIVRVAVTLKEKKEQIARISDLVDRIKAESQSDEAISAIRNLVNVKEEIESEEAPDQARLSKWLEGAKQAIQLGSFGYETVSAAKELLKLFGIG